MWYLYILECKNKSLYTGITNNLEKRLRAHQRGKGAWFTRVFGAGEILYTEECPSKRDAFIREHEIKNWPRKKKLILVNSSRRKKKRVRNSSPSSRFRRDSESIPTSP